MGKRKKRENVNGWGRSDRKYKVFGVGGVEIEKKGNRGEIKVKESTD